VQPIFSIFNVLTQPLRQRDAAQMCCTLAVYLWACALCHTYPIELNLQEQFYSLQLCTANNYICVYA